MERMLNGAADRLSGNARRRDYAPARMAKTNMEVLGIRYAPGRLRISAAVVLRKGGRR